MCLKMVTDNAVLVVFIILLIWDCFKGWKHHQVRERNEQLYCMYLDAQFEVSVTSSNCYRAEQCITASVIPGILHHCKQTCPDISHILEALILVETVAFLNWFSEL